jgi:hypothetical protein
MIGMYPTAFMILAQSKLDDFLLRKYTKRYVAIQEDRIDDRACKVIIREGVHGAITKTWIDPGRDYSIVRFEIENNTEAKPEIATYDIELEFHPSARVWFPAACSYRWLVGNEPYTGEDLTVRVERLNQSIDRGLFELSGMNIPPGTGLSVGGNLPASGRLAQWDSRSIVPIEPKPYRPPSSNTQNILLGLAALAAIGAAILGWKALSRLPRAR